jgi:hypothetical protein
VHVLTILLHLACTGTRSAPVPATADGLCVLGSPGDWTRCDGKRVQASGTVPEMVNNHPLLTGPEPSSRQTYMDVDGVGQIIVVTESMAECGVAMTVTGQLRRIDLGGEPGTRGSYAGWAIEGADITCP